MLKTQGHELEERIQSIQDQSTRDLLLSQSFRLPHLPTVRNQNIDEDLITKTFGQVSPGKSPERTENTYKYNDLKDFMYN